MQACTVSRSLLSSKALSGEAVLGGNQEEPMHVLEGDRLPRNPSRGAEQVHRRGVRDSQQVGHLGAEPSYARRASGRKARMKVS
ncbi:hypothetical protein WA016_03742 [Myxococcus stipitatus]